MSARAWIILSTALLMLTACGRPDLGSVHQVPADTTGSRMTAAPNSSGSQSTAAVRKMQLISATTGWALTDKRLLWTTNTGRTWSDAKLPQDLSPTDVLNAFFLDESHGWLVMIPRQAGLTPSFTILATGDGGKTWKQSTLSFPSNEYSNPPSGDVYVDFIDAQHGWVMVRIQSSSAFSLGALFHTEDGGNTWTKIAAPGGDPIHFTSIADGWTTNSVEGQIYVTHDGGQHWNPATIPLPRDQAVPTYELPTFLDEQHGVLPVTMSGEQAMVHFFVTSDAGRSWSLASTMQGGSGPGFGVTMPTSIHTDNTWTVVLPQGKIRKTKDTGKHWQDVQTNSLPDSIIKLSFATPNVGWAQRTKGTCAQHKALCSVQNEVLTTTDGGQTWISVLSLSTAE